KAVEQERQGRAAAEAEVKRINEQAEQRRLAALRAEEDRKAKAEAEAEAKRKADEAEQLRLAALRASSSTPSSSISDPRFSITKGVRVKGDEFKLIRDVKITRCSNECAENNLCRMFAYWPNQACYLFNQNFDIVPNNSESQVGVLLAEARAAARPERRPAIPNSLFTIQRGVEASWALGYPAGESLFTPSIEECEQKCAQRATCNLFTYNKRTGAGACYLYTRADLKPRANFDSGIRKSVKVQ